MTAINAVHQCLFCPQTFASAVEKDDHILNHFAHKTCTECNQNLIQIGGNLYTIHNAVTCVKVEMKIEMTSPLLDESMEKSESQWDTNSHSDDDGDYTEAFSTYGETMCTQEMQIKRESFEAKARTNTLTECFPTEPVAKHVEPVDSNSRSNKKTGRPKKSACLKDEKELTNLKQENVANKRNAMVPCDLCGKFMSKESIKRHKRVMHNEKGTVCKTCTKHFPTETEFVIHKPICEERKRNLERNKRGEFHCDTCKTIFKSKGSIRAHMRYYHDPEQKIKTVPAQCDLCGKLMRIDTISKHKRIVHRDPATPACTLCCKTFANAEQLTKHKQEVCDKSGAFECTICRKVYVLRASLKKHIQKHHDPGYKKSAPVPCEICGKVMRKESLSKHKRIVHITIGKHACKFCARVFSSEEEFLTHKSLCLWKRSNNESFKIGKYECVTCKITFQLKSSLEKHTNLLHQ
ncbi:zinc finger protein 62 homolog [Contarinia nasturtii]|uniref:zinc finger protein 62 homolog n=1 Tax=Contarinia nasturtii TaxID=265458 RepID=UPI0012D40E84|nr:zinc finger protein 62 homolog [Contarinia nasturtii]